MTDHRPERIPYAMRKLDHWVGADVNKAPINPTTELKASPTDPATWGTFAHAATFARYRGLSLGIVLTRDAGITCIDLDHCRDSETGAIEAWAQTIVDRLDSYTEVSISGSGLHIFCLGTLPPGRRRCGQIETYDDGRFIIVTGNALEGHTTLQDRTAELAAFHRETFPPPPPKPSPPITSGPLHLDDSAIVERARRSEKFRRLYDGGDMSDYADNWSDADLGELCHLVRAGADTPEQLDRIHRAGSLMRDKWDTRRGTSSYGEWTISKALDGHVTPAYHAPIITTANPGDPCGDTRDALAEARETIARLTRERDEAKAEAKRFAEFHSAAMALLGNQALNPAERIVALMTMKEVAADDRGEPDGTAHHIPTARIAERAGVSCSTATGALKTLEAGLIVPTADGNDVAPVHVIDRTVHWDTTAEKKQAFYARTGGDLAADLRTLAAATRVNTRNHGGKRTPCPTCGSTHRKTICADCGHLFHDDPAPAGVKTHHADLLGDPVPPGVKTHDADLLGDPIAADTNPIATGVNTHDADLLARPDRDHTPPVVTYLRRVNLATYHKPQLAPDAADRIAAARADMRARRCRGPAEPVPKPTPVTMPGIDSVPYDRYTDVTGGW